MKRALLSLLVVVLSLSLVAGLLLTGCTEQKQETVDLDFTFAAGPTGALGESVTWFAEEVGLRTDGAVTIEVHYGGVLLEMADTLPGIGSGIADCGLAMGRYTVSQNPSWHTLGLLGAGNDVWAIIQAGYEMVTSNEAMIEELTAQNVVALTGYTSGTPVYVLTKPVTTMADLDGLRMGSASPDEANIMPELGIEPVEMLMPDSYDALDTGAIDGLAGTIAFADSYSFQEVAKYWMRFSNNLPAGDVTIMFNKDVWDGFTEQTREVIMDIAQEWGDVYAQKMIESEAATVATVEADFGVQIFHAPADIDAVYQDALAASHESYFQQWDAEGYDTRGIWDEFRDLVAEYEEELAAEGYPWER